MEKFGSKVAYTHFKETGQIPTLKENVRILGMLINDLRKLAFT